MEEKSQWKSLANGERQRGWSGSVDVSMCRCVSVGRINLHLSKAKLDNFTPSNYTYCAWLLLNCLKIKQFFIEDERFVPPTHKPQDKLAVSLMICSQPPQKASVNICFLTHIQISWSFITALFSRCMNLLFDSKQGRLKWYLLEQQRFFWQFNTKIKDLWDKDINPLRKKK